ncbi:MAG TPA: hypothetical protein VMG59_08390 [Phycisphaerae bacterium]|nr:hypothetical protein [Phycisphaerae bacterium]
MPVFSDNITIHAMSDPIVTVNPSGYMPPELAPARPNPIQMLAWFIFLIAGALCLIIALKILYIELPATLPADFDRKAIAEFTLQLLGLLLSGGAIALAPKIKSAQYASVAILMANFVVVLFQVFTGLFIQSPFH